MEKQSSVVFVDYKGIKVKDLAELRKQLKEGEARFQVVKKTLLSKTLAEKGIEVNSKELSGQLALVFSFGDPLSGIKKAYTFAKNNEHLKFLGGYFENHVMDESQIKELALLPSREELLSRLLGSLASPIQGFASVLQGNIKGLVIALSAIQKNKST